MDLENFKGSSDEYYRLVFTESEWFLKHCLLGGFTFSIESGKLRVSPANQIDEEMTALIKAHKAGLIKILKSEETYDD